MVDYTMFKKENVSKGTKTYISFDSTNEKEAETYNQIMALKNQYDLKAIVSVSIAKLHETVTK